MLSKALIIKDSLQMHREVWFCTLPSCWLLSSTRSSNIWGVCGEATYYSTDIIILLGYGGY